MTKEEIHGYRPTGERGFSSVSVRKALVEEGARPTVVDRHGNRRTSLVMSSQEAENNAPLGFFNLLFHSF